MAQLFELPNFNAIMFKSFELPKVDALVAPYKALNELALANVEKLVALQSTNYVKYSNLALASLKEAAAVTDVEQSKAFAEKQVELSKKVASDIQADVQVASDMSKAYVAELQSVVAASVKKAA